ncbi:class I SAM-dependent methyltransferase [Luteibacter sp. 3190]|uniref:class I SAM-dependent methyltransferase n=1 Tax=Luteibacter sp. 3190 TaxID=2817736 RepID=UPI00286057D0|nr:class I SAM-dependent methyltransferase [Luteibacter sp. 3190]MDR6935336.1 ubiquinone/menaquinone biosynthesis C-methylase UbiE [Luteibacter sp. 3190]
MNESFDISYAFYEQLGAEGLSARTRAEWDTQIVQQLLLMLEPGQCVLDVGCGYGRTSLPLVESGYRVVGLDISNRLLRAHQEEAGRRGVSLELIRASMCSMPFQSNTFDVAMCLWSAFYELLTVREQLAAIKEAFRVIRPGGWYLMEGTVYEHAVRAQGLDDDVRSNHERLVQNTIEGLKNPHFGHDAESLTRLMLRSGIKTFDTYVDNWAGRPRRFLRFSKPE